MPTPSTIAHIVTLVRSTAFRRHYALHFGHASYARVRGRRLKAVLQAGLLFVACHSGAPPADADLLEQLWTEQSDVRQCAKCHNRQQGDQFVDPSFARQDEITRWVKLDKHSQARARIEPIGGRTATANNAFKLSWDMCQRLGYDVLSDAGYKKYRDNCLTCHGGYQHGSDPGGFERPPSANFADAANMGTPGVGCNYCHENGESDAWVDKHHEEVDDGDERHVPWRSLPPELKEREGMRDLVNMSKQTALCADCHIGNIQQHRFVTHEMYAAGHPPLPAFELETFCRAMPQHWRTPDQLFNSLTEAAKANARRSERLKSERDVYFKVNYPRLFESVQQGDSPFNIAWSTRKTLVASIEARDHAVQLLADAVDTEHWGDYALFDCTACHHELRTNSLRQHRGFPGAPGRPREHVWPSVLLENAITNTSAAPAYSSAQHALDMAFSARPFGDAQLVKSAADQMTHALEDAQVSVAGRRMYASDAQAVYSRLASSPLDALIEYDSARNIIWALHSIQGDLVRLGTADERQAAELSQLVERDSGSTLIEIDLPSGRETNMRRDASIYKNLPAELRRRAAYSPEELAARLRQLTPHVPSN